MSAKDADMRFAPTDGLYSTSTIIPQILHQIGIEGGANLDFFRRMLHFVYSFVAQDSGQLLDGFPKEFFV